MDWLIEYFEDSDKRVRIFKIMAFISQAMVALGVAIFMFLFRDNLTELFS